MRIAFTIEIGDTQSVKVQSADVKVQSADVKQKGDTKQQGKKEDKFVPTREWIGEGKPNGKGWYNKLGETDMPYCAGQVKDLLTKLQVPISAVGKAIGMDPNKFRNLLRIDARGFSEEDYNVIMKAAQGVRQERNKEIM